MATTNTSFEHVLHNLQERNRIIEDCKTILHNLFQSIEVSQMNTTLYNCIKDID